MSSSSFTQIRGQALNLEKQTEGLLTKYSNFQNQVGSQIEDDEQFTVNQIKDLFDKREEVLSKLNRVSETETISTSKLQQLTRHKEILQDHKKSYFKISLNIEEERNRSNLLSNVRSGINASKQRNDQQIDANDYILDERVRVDNANSLADRLLNQAFQTRDDLINQRQYLQNAQQKMLSSIQSIPGINVIISKINTRRKRDTLILATVITMCIILLFFL
jgi:Golgi SNAP receptor complex protein 1